MARTGITYHEVANAIATLQGRQKNPTIDTIREELGTGSKSTIAKFMQQWKIKSGVTNTNEMGIPNELQQLIRGLWEKIQSDADVKIEKHRLEADTEILDAKNTVALTQQQNALLHIDITALTEKLNAQMVQSHELTTKLHQAENEKTRCDGCITSLETQNVNHKNENERLHQLLKNTQDNLVHYQQSVEKQRFLQQMQIEKERADYTLKLTILEKQFSKMSEEKSVVETKYHLLNDECQIQKSHLVIIEKENVQRQLKNNELMTKNTHLCSQREKLENDIVTISQALNENEKVCHELTIEVAILKNENDAFNKKSTSDENKIRLIQNDLNQLSQENASLKRTVKEATV